MTSSQKSALCLCAAKLKRVRSVFVILLVLVLGTSLFTIKRMTNKVTTMHLDTGTLQKKVFSWNTSVNTSYLELFRQMKSSSNELSDNLKEFKVAVSEDDYKLLLDILSTLARTMDKHNLTYFLYGGTLIGSLRHHGPIPWDDDVDVMASWHERDKIIAAFKALEPDYQLYSTTKRHFWKLYSKHSRVPKGTNVPWKYPFVDIWLFKKEGAQLYDWSNYWYDLRLPAKHVFPLQKRRFADLELNCPCDADAFLSVLYKWNECVSRTWGHRDEWQEFKATRTVPCSKFVNTFPFVRRRAVENGTEEILLYKGTVVGHQALPKLC